MDYIKKNAYLKQVMRNIRLAFDKFRNQKKKGGKVEKKEEAPEKKEYKAKVIVANHYADWQKTVLEILASSNFNKLTIVDDWKAKIRSSTTGDIMKKSLQFGSWILVLHIFVFSIRFLIGRITKKRR